MNPTTATAKAIMEIKPQEMATLGPFSRTVFGFTFTAPLGEAVKGVLQAGHLTFLPTSSSLTLSRFPQLSHTTRMAMVEFSECHFEIIFASELFACQINQIGWLRKRPNGCKLSECMCRPA